MPVTRRRFINYAVTGTVVSAASGFSFAQKSGVKKPNKLEPGMTVGLVSPASNAEENEDILASIEFVKSLGFEAKASRNLFARNQYLAGTDQQRAQDLNAFFADP